MIYNETILKFIEIVDSVLLGCNQKKLLENKDFSIPESYLNVKDYFVIDLIKKNNITLRFWFENTDLRIDIGGIEEAYIFDYNDIDNNKKEIKNLIKMIFTYKIKVESCGNTYKKIFFITLGKKNIFITNTRHSLLSLIGIKWNCTIMEYPPIY